MSQEKQADARARVYTYTAQDGTVFFSFSRKPKVITPSQILTLESRVGTHLENFIPRFRAQSRQFVGPQKDEGDE